MKRRRLIQGETINGHISPADSQLVSCFCTIPTQEISLGRLGKFIGVAFLF